MYVLIRVQPYDKTNNHHNLAGVVLASSFYEKFYNKRPFVAPEIVIVYSTTINITAVNTVMKCAELVHKAKQYDRALYEAANTGCVHFIMSVLDEIWYKELEDSDTFYNNVTALQIIKHL